MLTRRSVLRAGLYGVLGGVLAPSGRSSIHGNRSRLLQQSATYESWNEKFGNPPLLGRVEAEWQPLQAIRSVITDPDSVTRFAKFLEIIPIYGAVHAEPPFPRYKHNDLWFQTADGFIHSSYVVPVREIFNDSAVVTGGGFWGMISVPLTRQHASPDPLDRGKHKLYFGQVFRVAERVFDSGGTAWYRLLDDGYVKAWWVEAQFVMRLPKGQFSPISPHVSPADKRIEVNLSSQSLECYEGHQRVFATRVASGRGYINDKGEQFGFATPPGTHWIQHKRPSRHMAGGDPESVTNRYDIPGVPWCTYFTSTGAAIHGAFWHNNFGVPQSHGCLNVTVDAAHWIYRWVDPWTGEAPDSEWTDHDDRGNTTAIIVTE